MIIAILRVLWLLSYRERDNLYSCCIVECDSYTCCYVSYIYINSNNNNSQVVKGGNMWLYDDLLRAYSLQYII